MDGVEKRSEQTSASSNDFQDEENEENGLNPIQIYRSFFAEYSITAEFNLFAQQNLPGIYCIPTAADAYEWLGVLFLRQGIYQGAILRFSLRLPADFPETETAPSLAFEISVFHPDVAAETGELNVKRGFPTWKYGIHHVYQVLVYMQRCFFAIDCAEPVMNLDAAKLCKEDMEKFCERAADSVRRSRELVYDPPQSNDANAIKFTPWDQTVHELIRTRILKSSKFPMVQASPSSLSSLSWSSSSTSLAHLRNGSGARSAGLSFFDERTFTVMAKEKSWPATASSSTLAAYSGAINGDTRKIKSPAKPKLV